MIGVQQRDALNDGILVIDEYFEIEIPKKVKIHFVTIVSNGHDKSALFIEYIYFFLQRKFSIIWPGDHTLNINEK